MLDAMQLPVVGAVFAQRYRLEEELGRGGFAVVYGAVDLRDGSDVAVRIITPDERDGYDSTTRARFERETRILQALRHPHIVDEREVGMSDAGLLYVVFERLRGRDLSELLAERGHLDPRLVRSIMHQVLQALDAAHQRGLLHRDLKPDNIRVVDESPAGFRVKLLDFGIARGADDGSPAITATGELLGTPRYMSPEQLRGAKLTPGSDIYSLGLLAFELLVGPRVLAGNSIFDQIARMEQGYQFHAPMLDRADPVLRDVLQRMTFQEPERRFPNARAVLAALAQGDLRSQVVAAPADSSPRRLIGLLGMCAVIAIAGGVWAASATKQQQTVATATSRAPIQTETANTATEQPAPPATAHKPVPRNWGLPNPRKSSGCGLPLPQSTMLVGRLGAYWPEGYDNKTPLPAVFLLNEKDRGASELADRGFADLAEHVGLVLLAPDERNYQDDPENVAAAMREQIENAQDTLCIDTSRVFVVSHARGGRGAAPLACVPWVTAVTFHAFGLRYSNNGTLDRELEFLWCDTPKPVLWLSPSASKIEPTDGSASCNDDRKRVSYDELTKMWAQRNRCEPNPTDEELPTGTCKQWRCETPFRSCLIEGGYPWSGKTSIAHMHRCGGVPERAGDFPKVQAMWEFLSQAPPLPEP